MRSGTVAAVRSSTNSLLAPPMIVSLALSCQSVLAKPGLVDVSSNLRRGLFAFILTVTIPKVSELVQSTPPQRPPAAETKSGKYVFGTGSVGRAAANARSTLSGETTAPFAIVNEPDCVSGAESPRVTCSAYGDKNTPGAPRRGRQRKSR